MITLLQKEFFKMTSFNTVAEIAGYFLILQKKGIWIVAAMIGTLTTLLGKFWADPSELKVLLAAIVFNFLLGFYKAWHEHDIQPSKILRLPFAIICIFSLLILLHEIIGLKSELGFLEWIPNTAFWGYLLYYLTSIIENMALVGFMPKPLAAFILNKLNVSEIMNKMTQRKELPNLQEKSKDRLV